jgi:hypothetical protein
MSEQRFDTILYKSIPMNNKTHCQFFIQSLEIADIK